MEDRRERVMNQIRKLLAYKGQDHATGQEEIENALNTARRLMDKWNIEEAEALNTGSMDEPGNAMGQHDAYFRKKLNPWMCTLAWTPCHICDVRFYVDDQGPRGQFIMFYGLVRDVAVAVDLYKELLATTRLMCKIRYGEARPKEYQSYCKGFTDILFSRSLEMKKASVVESNTTAIVLRKDSLIDDWKSKNLNSLSPIKRRSQKVLTDAYSEGANDGANVVLNSDGIHQSPNKINLLS